MSTIYFDPVCSPHLCKVGEECPASSYGSAAHDRYIVTMED